jgi:hypothetical protein
VGWKQTQDCGETRTRWRDLGVMLTLEEGVGVGVGFGEKSECCFQGV